MTSTQLLNFAICLLLHFTSISATPVMDKEKNKYEEYIIEHEISATQAKNVALSTDIQSLIVPAGCQECTKEERHYCTSSDLISDHCCCDRRFHENLPYIPHTCYFGTQLCTTIATDCNKYTRLRTCCCDKYLLQKWKEKYSSGNADSLKSKGTLVLFILFIVYIFV